ncbi:MAG: hypothetical protein GC171_04625 [Terrimonas sp.]|nr:hypothetical protein [Terrimonas sp.]
MGCPKSCTWGILNQENQVICRCMRIRLPRYTNKDYIVLAVIILPLTILLNSVIFGMKYFSQWVIFSEATLITATAVSADFILCGSIAVLLKRRFPGEAETGKRLTLMIIVFLLVTGIFLLLLFRGYESIRFWGYVFNENGFVWSYVVTGIVNIFLTFLHEGIDRFERWKSNLKETEALKIAFRHSQLEGLKSQVNPHFLFNSLNSLSSLISEDEEKAEKFLNEMSKVYRYLLRNEEDKLVSIRTELVFLASYYFLLKTRYGQGLKIEVAIDEADKEKFIPPMTLQLIIENAFSQNMMSKSSPLVISIFSDSATHTIRVCNNVQPKKVADTTDLEAGLDNLVKKYQLLNQPEVLIEDSDDKRCITLPLIFNQEEVLP